LCAAARPAFSERRSSSAVCQERWRARRVLDRALRAAARAGVEADGEILEKSPQQSILEFAAARGARLVVVGSRGRKLGRNVPGAIVRAPDFVR
jgi:nucleotide-binding universal stress UspA family protein